MRTDNMIEKYRSETTSGGIDVAIEALKLCDELLKMTFANKSELNRYLKGLTCDQRVKDKARERFYRYTKLNKKDK